jgi:hypothetical protein
MVIQLQAVGDQIEFEGNLRENQASKRALCEVV